MPRLNRRVPDKRWLTRFRIILFILCLVPMIRLLWLSLNDDLTANPVEFIERSTGYWSLFMLLLTLSLSPIRLLTGSAWPQQYRRMLGLFMFFYACLHLLAYLWLDYNFDWEEIIKDITKHPYVLVGATAFILTVPLAVTSNQYMIRKLRERWKQLHYLAYFIAILGTVHFLWLVKKDLREPILYASILTVLLIIRVHHKLSKEKPYIKR